MYSAPSLAAELGVSATPVREAMLDLAREGLVEAVRNKGFRITEMTDRDLDEFTEIRTLIEVPTVGRVARSARPEQLEALRPLARQIVTAAERHDVLAYLEADHQFHLELLSLAGNQHLSRWWPTCASGPVCTGWPTSTSPGGWSPPRRSTSSCST